MKRILALLIGAALIGCESTAPVADYHPFNTPDDVQHVERAHNFDVMHYSIGLRLPEDFGKSETMPTIAGKTEIEFTSPTGGEVAFDAVNFKIFGVSLNDHAAKYSYDGKLITLTPEEIQMSNKLTVEYEMTPEEGLYYVAPRPWRNAMLWSQGEPQLNRCWFPCYDYPNDRASFDVTVSVPQDYYVVSNGKLESLNFHESAAMFHWKESIAVTSYLVSIIVGKFDVVEDSVASKGKKVPLYYFAPSGISTPEKIKQQFGGTPAMISFYEEITGVPYPYEKYAQTGIYDFSWGGMENVSATTLNGYHLGLFGDDDESDPTGLLAHELAHQWSGDYITCKNWFHIWLNEGFATFFEALWNERKNGREDYTLEMNGNMGGYFGETERYKRPVVCSIYPDEDAMFDGHTYSKGALVLNMLRDLLGDKTFFEGLKIYFKDFGLKCAVTGDFRQSMEKAYGKKLQWFFDQWLYRATYPDLDVTYKVSDTSVSIDFAQKESVFRLPMRIVVTCDDDVTDTRVTIDQQKQKVQIPTRSKAKMVEIDPENIVVKKMKVNRAPAESLEVFLKSKFMLSRVKAAEELRGQAISDDLVAKCEEIVKASKNKHLVRAAIEILKQTKTLRALKILEETYQRFSDVPQIQMSILDSLFDFESEEAVKFAERVLDRSSPFFAKRRATGLLTKKKDGGEILKREITSAASTPFTQSRLIGYMEKCSLETDVPFLVALTGPEVHSIVRVSALYSLGKFAKDPAAIDVALKYIDDGWMAIQGACIELLKKSKSKEMMEKLRKQLEVESDYRIRKRINDALKALEKD